MGVVGRSLLMDGPMGNKLFTDPVMFLKKNSSLVHRLSAMLDRTIVFYRRLISSIAHDRRVTHVSRNVSLLFSSSHIPAMSTDRLAGNDKICHCSLSGMYTISSNHNINKETRSTSGLSIVSKNEALD